MKLKLKPKKRLVEKPLPKIEKAETIPVEKSSRKNTLPPDEYEPIFEPWKLKLREYISQKSGEKVEQFLIMKVMRNKYDDGKVYFYMTMYQESESYTGYLKGKTVFFPVTKLDDTIGLMCEAIRKCEEDELVKAEIESDGEEGEELPF